MDSKIKTQTEYEHEEAVLGLMLDEMLNFLKTQEKNWDWLHGQEASTILTAANGNDKEKSTEDGPETLDLLTKLSQIQLNPEDRLSELTYQVSETKAEENVWLTTSEFNELIGQLEELKIRRDNVEKLLESVSNSSNDMEVTMKKRQIVLQEHNKIKQENEGDGDNNMESYLQHKYAPIAFDEEKAQATLDRLESLQKERADQMKRLTSQTGEFLLPKTPIPPNIYMAQQQLDERKAYLNELKEKIENLTSSTKL